jgi:hypothetical protein
MSERTCNVCDKVLEDKDTVACYGCYREVARELDDAQEEIDDLEKNLKDAEECVHTEYDYGILLKEARELELENIELKHQIKELKSDQSGKKV